MLLQFTCQCCKHIFNGRSHGERHPKYCCKSCSNTGRAKSSIIHQCPNCGIVFERPDWSRSRHCSRKCVSEGRKGKPGKSPSQAALAKMSANARKQMTGVKRSNETRERLANATAQALAQGRMPQRSTAIEQILADFLRSAGFTVRQQVAFGRACVDVYVPELHLAFEADGDYWHNRAGAKERDARRDDTLLRQFGLPVVRLTETELHAIEPRR